MSSKSPKFYVVRTFKPFTEIAFTSIGTLDKLQSFNEETVLKSHEVIVALMSNSQTMIETIFDKSGILIEQLDNPFAAKNQFQIVDFRVQTDIEDKDELRAYRTGVREAIKVWAEKSRIKGVRGFRVSAVKTPSFEMTHSGYVLRFQVILGNSVFYNQKRVTVGMPSLSQFYEDAESLKKFLTEALDNQVSEFKFDHSIYGKNEVV